MCSSDLKRPLGIPTFRDKIVQEVLRQILESIYEPTFSYYSHGFRPKRSCHTALYQIKKKTTGSIWAIEGDITGFFDNISHDVLIDILKRKIKDGRIIELIRRFLKAGYMEHGIIRNTITGTPQGGIISPLLANIYLNELDHYVMKLKSQHCCGKKRYRNNEYRRINYKVNQLFKKGKNPEALSLRKRMRQLPSIDNMDPNYRRLFYCRYADDFVIFVIGPKELAFKIKQQVSQFLNEQLQIELSQEKTFITNLRKKSIRFLGYEIKKTHNNSKITKDKHNKTRRAINGTIMLRVPYDIIIKKTKQFMKDRKPKARKERIKLNIVEMIDSYNAEIRGLYNYYSLAYNVSKELSRFKYFHYYSLIYTLTNKLRSRVPNVIKKYSIPTKRKLGTGTFNLLGTQYKTRNNELKTITYFNESLKWKKEPQIDIEPPELIEYSYSQQLIDRLARHTCELCHKTGSKYDFEIHHIRKLKDLKRKWAKRGKIVPQHVLVMSRIRRKTLIVCKQCHIDIHNGLI